MFRHRSLDLFMERYKKRIDSAYVIHTGDLKADGDVPVKGIASDAPDRGARCVCAPHWDAEGRSAVHLLRSMDAPRGFFFSAAVPSKDATCWFLSVIHPVGIIFSAQ